MSDGFIKKENINKKSAYITGGVIGVIITLVSMLVFAAALLFFNIDRAYSAPFATISIALGSFIASYIAAKKTGERGYLTGIIIGTIVFIVITVLSLIMGNGLSLNTLFHFIIIMLSSIVGGIMGVNRDKHKKYI